MIAAALAAFTVATVAPPRATVALSVLAGRDASKPFVLQVVLTPPEGWHTYWVNPGESGAPTKIDLALPPGWKAKAAEWPAPERYVSGEETTFVYSRPTTFRYAITPLTSSTGNPKGKIDVRVSGLLCRDVCVPLRAEATLRYPPAQRVAMTYGLDPIAKPPVRYVLRGKSVAVEGLPPIRDAFDFGSTIDPSTRPVRAGSETRFALSAYAPSKVDRIRLLVVPVDGVPFTVVALPRTQQ